LTIREIRRGRSAEAWLHFAPALNRSTAVEFVTTEEMVQEEKAHWLGEVASARFFPA